MNTLGERLGHRARRKLFAALDDAISAGNPGGVQRALATHGRGVGLSGSVRNELTTIITGRLTNTLTHTDANHHLHTLATTLPPLPTHTWLTLENIARSIGCFHASHHFTTRAHTTIHTTPHPPETRFRSHLHTRNLTGATETYTTLPHHKKHTPFWQDAGHYLWLWSNHSHGTPHHTTDPTWTTLLTHHHLTILGPTPTTTPHRTGNRAGRIVMGGGFRPVWIGL